MLEKKRQQKKSLLKKNRIKLCKSPNRPSGCQENRGEENTIKIPLSISGIVYIETAANQENKKKWVIQVQTKRQNEAQKSEFHYFFSSPPFSPQLWNSMNRSRKKAQTWERQWQQKSMRDYRPFRSEGFEFFKVRRIERFRDAYISYYTMFENPRYGISISSPALRRRRCVNKSILTYFILIFIFIYFLLLFIIF